MTLSVSCRDVGHCVSLYRGQLLVIEHEIGYIVIYFYNVQQSQNKAREIWTSRNSSVATADDKQVNGLGYFPPGYDLTEATEERRGSSTIGVRGYRLPWQEMHGD